MAQFMRRAKQSDGARRNRLRSLSLVAIGAAAVLLAPARPFVAPPAPAAGPATAQPVYTVEEYRDVPYCDGPGAAPAAHTLDLFLPKGKKDYPVVVFIHGGIWMLLDKSWGGLYSNVGRCLAEQGIGAVLPNYRLSPAVRHPAHVEDVARAVAWTVRHISKYGGRADQVFLAGHSAGGHLASLLATDPAYLKAAGADPAVVRGVISVSGVYQIDAFDLSVALPGPAAQAAGVVAGLLGLPGVRLSAGASTAGSGAHSTEAGLGIRLNPLALVFGSDPKVWRAASPLNHVHAGLPPFLIFNADRDLPTLPGQAQRFAAALKENRCQVEALTVLGRDHESLIWEADRPTDPVARAMYQFIQRHAAPAGPTPAGQAGRGRTASPLISH
jgi:acetyl esterase/lipase